jgi:hypothetical protein
VVAAANRGLMREPHDYTIRPAARPGVRRDTGEVKCPQERGPWRVSVRYFWKPTRSQGGDRSSGDVSVVRIDMEAGARPRGGNTDRARQAR